jgi:sulfate adenylyltransferase subunit 1 (EFTu-like GTPase family)
VLIDPITNATVAAGMIRETTAKALIGSTEPVSAVERASRWHHSGALVHLSGPKFFADAAERALFLRGAFIVRLAAASADALTALTSAGVLVMTHIQSDEQTVTLNHQRVFAAADVDELLRILEDHNILQGETRR